MLILHQISDFIHPVLESSAPPNYYYKGYSQRLPRTALSEEVARGLMRHLEQDAGYSQEGKMYGILIVELPSGDIRVIKAFSGLLNGESFVPGWAPPIPGRTEVAFDEAQVLSQLDTIKQELITLQQIPERQEYENLSLHFADKIQQLNTRHQQRKQQRQQRRLQLSNINEEELLEESRRDGIEKKLLKRQRDETLHPLKQIIESANIRITELKQQRKEISRQLQAKMHAVYSLTNFLGMSQSLQQLMPQAPTGTGDCCAPKLLHYAATHNLKPLAMAEFWWGESLPNGDKIQGEFYGACSERCQPIMGFLLSGLQTIKLTAPPQNLLYEDEYIIAINKPSGLLSVPGRYRNTQDSVLSRLRNTLTDGMKLIPVHRLDQDTSGILLIARNLDIYRQLAVQFQQRQVHKVYEAVLSGNINSDTGIIELPLWGNPQNRPYQEVNWEHGKKCTTHYFVIDKSNYTRIEFIPLTGRPHQLRVHAADKQGLGTPILGDSLYGSNNSSDRLHLHARELHFTHPILGQFSLQTKAPF